MSTNLWCNCSKEFRTPKGRVEPPLISSQFDIKRNFHLLITTQIDVTVYTKLFREHSGFVHRIDFRFRYFLQDFSTVLTRSLGLDCVVEVERLSGDDDEHGTSKVEYRLMVVDLREGCAALAILCSVPHPHHLLSANHDRTIDRIHRCCHHCHPTPIPLLLFTCASVFFPRSLLLAIDPLWSPVTIQCSGFQIFAHFLSFLPPFLLLPCATWSCQLRGGQITLQPVQLLKFKILSFRHLTPFT